MQEIDLEKLVSQIQSRKCESQYVEIKAAHEGCPKRLYDTLSSFSNQDEGGVIVFGIDEKKDFEIVGVYDAQDIQKKVNEQSKEKGNRPNKGVLRSCRRRGRADERI